MEPGEAGYPLNDHEFTYKPAIWIIDQNVSFWYSLKGDSSLEMDTTWKSEWASTPKIVIRLGAAINKESIHAGNSTRIIPWLTSHFLNSMWFNLFSYRCDTSNRSEKNFVLLAQVYNKPNTRC